MAGLLTLPFFDVGAGISPADGALLYFNVVGSETDKDTYTTAAATTPHANPVVANSKGVFEAIYLVGNYDWVLTDKNLVQINTGSVSELVTGSGQAENVLSRDTLNDAVIDTSLQAGLSINIAERTTGNGGGAMWDVVLSSTVTENTFDIVQCTGVATLSLVLRIEGEVNVKTFGATGDGATDDYTSVLAAIKTGLPLYWPAGNYIIGTSFDYNALDLAGFDVRNVIWRGDGSDDTDGGGTTISYTGTGTFLPLGIISPQNYQATVSMRNIYFKGNGAIGHTATTYFGFQTVTRNDNGCDSTQTCMNLTNSGIFHSKISECRFKFWDTAIHQEEDFFGLNLMSCLFHTNNKGWKIGVNCTSSTAFKCEWAGHYAGVHIYSSNQGITVKDCTFEANDAGAGMLISASQMTIIKDNYFSSLCALVGADAGTPTNGAGVINDIYWQNNFAGVLEIGDNVRNVFVEKSLVTTITNAYSYQNASVARRISVDTDCFDVDLDAGHFMQPLDNTNFLGANAGEIIHGHGGTSCNRNAVQTLTTATAEAIIWTSENYDENNLHSLSVTPERIIVDRPGKYNITAGLSYASNATGFRRTEIRINGAIIAPDSRVPITGGNTQVSLSLTVELEDTDYIELWAYQTSGGNLNTISAAGDRPYLNVQILN